MHVSYLCSAQSYATDLVVCVALGCDMFDCVYPTRTAVSTCINLGGNGVASWMQFHQLMQRNKLALKDCKMRGGDFVGIWNTHPLGNQCCFQWYLWNMWASFHFQRFGSALVPWGSLQLKNKKYAKDFRPIDENCTCPTCQRFVCLGWSGFLNK